MRRLLPSLVMTLGVTACAVNVGAVPDIPLSAVGLRVPAGTGAEDVSAVIKDAAAEAALVAGPADSAWFAELAEATGLTLSGPATAGDLGLGFLAGEPIGDTTVVLTYDGGSLTVRDALYDLDKQRYLDLLAFRIDDPASARQDIEVLVEYVATEVMNSAAVIMAVAVPTAAVGDSVGRLLSPAYFDALRCEPGLASRGERERIRLFYGPEARVYCRAATVSDPAIGDVIRASLILGRR